MLQEWKAASLGTLSKWLCFYVNSLNIHWRKTREQVSRYSQRRSWSKDLDSGPCTCKYGRSLFDVEQHHQEIWNGHLLWHGVWGFLVTQGEASHSWISMVVEVQLWERICQRYMLWNKEKLWMYLTGSQPVQHILTSHHCVWSRSNAPQLPGRLCVPYCIRNNLKGFGLFVALFCHRGASVSAKDFIMLQPFTGEHSEMSLLHFTTS